MVITIRTVKNGFIVYPTPTERFEETEQSETVVFETFDALVKHLEQFFGPLVKPEMEEFGSHSRPIEIKPGEVQYHKGSLVDCHKQEQVESGEKH